MLRSLVGSEMCIRDRHSNIRSVTTSTPNKKSTQGMLMLAITRVGTTLGLITPHNPLTDPYTPDHTPVPCKCNPPIHTTCYSCTFVHRIHTNSSAARWRHTIKHPKPSMRRQHLHNMSHNNAPSHTHAFPSPTQQELSENLNICRHPPHQLSDIPPRNAITPRELNRL